MGQTGAQVGPRRGNSMSWAPRLQQMDGSECWEPPNSPSLPRSNWNVPRASLYFLLWYIIHNIKVTILTILKCQVQWHKVVQPAIGFSSRTFLLTEKETHAHEVVPQAFFRITILILARTMQYAHERVWEIAHWIYLFTGSIYFRIRYQVRNQIYK